MNKFEKYADDLVKLHGKERALHIAESSLKASNAGANTYFYTEAAWYTDKEGRIQLAKDQKKFTGIRENRINTNVNFWKIVTNTIKKRS